MPKSSLLSGSKRAAALGFQRLGMQRFAFRGLEWTRTLRAAPEILRRERRLGPDGLPLPPPLLQVQVTGAADSADFLAQGHRAEATIRQAVAATGRELEQFEDVLDFGCGCGRVMRRWSGLSGPRLYGSDYNGKLVDWCREALPFAQFSRNELEPPLPFDDGAFDLVYALSVFTHLTEPLQLRWMDELARVIRPGGLLLLTTKGDAWSWKLDAAERRRYESGEVIVRYSDVEGTNLCAAFHPTKAVATHLARSAFIERLVSPAALEDGKQDVHVLERIGT